MTPVLELDAAWAELGSELGINAPISLRLLPGECALIEMRGSHQLPAFADLCSGLLKLRSGQVRFTGRDWTTLPHDYAAALRGCIGRLFASGGWLPFLDIETNILLPALYHTRRDREELRREALALAQEFGLPGLRSASPASFPQPIWAVPPWSAPFSASPCSCFWRSRRRARLSHSRRQCSTARRWRATAAAQSAG